MSFDPSDGASLSELIRLVRKRVHDFPKHQRQPETADGVTTVYPLRESVYVTNGVSMTDNAAAETHFSVDYDSCEVTLTYTTTDGNALIFDYWTVRWDDERITEALNAAIDQLPQRFCVRGQNDAITTTGEAEILVETASGDDLGARDTITKVEYWTGARWTRIDTWSPHDDWDANKKYIRFEMTPVQGLTLRVGYAVRPAYLLNSTDTLEGTCGLVSELKEPLVLLAVASLEDDRIHARIRDDRAHNTQDENPVKSYEIQNDAQYLRAQAEARLLRIKSDPPPTRVSF